MVSSTPSLNPPSLIFANRHCPALLAPFHEKITADLLPSCLHTLTYFPLYACQIQPPPAFDAICARAHTLPLRSGHWNISLSIGIIDFHSEAALSGRQTIEKGHIPPPFARMR